MGTLARGFLLRYWQPQLQIVRNKTKLHVTKPRPLPFQRQLLETVCKPYFVKEKKKPYVPDHEKCGSVLKLRFQIENPLEKILAREALNWVNQSKLIAIFHRNVMDSEETFQCRLLLKKNGMRFLTYGRNIMRMALTGTIYEPSLILFQSHTSVVVGQDPDMQKLLAVAKKIPKLSLMAAIVEDRLLSVTELEHYGKFTNLDAARANFVAVLTSSSNNIVQQLNHHPNAIVQLLNMHQDLNKKSSQEISVTAPEESSKSS